MIEVYDNIQDILNTPQWSKDHNLTVEFIFRNGTKLSANIDTSCMDWEDIAEVHTQILKKRSLLQAIFEHNSHGQITVQGLTVRADDLSAVRIM